MKAKTRLLGIDDKGNRYYFSEKSKNPFSIATGKGGGGKTYFNMSQIIQAAKNGEKVLTLNLRKTISEDTIAPELYAEYEKLVCRHDIASEGLSLPLFKKYNDENGVEENEEVMINRVTAMFASSCDLKPTQKAAVYNAVKDVYRKGYYLDEGTSVIYRWLTSQKAATAKAAAGKILPLCVKDMIREGDFFNDQKPITEIDLNGLEYDDQLLFVKFILNYIQRAAMKGCYIKNPLLIFVDEIQSLFETKAKNEPLEVLLNEGRRLNVRLIMGCPSMISLSKKTNALMQCATMMFFEPLASERAKIAELVDPADSESMNYALSILGVGECMAKGTFDVKSKDGITKTVTDVFKIKTKFEGDVHHENFRRETDSKVHSDKAAS